MKRKTDQREHDANMKWMCEDELDGDELDEDGTKRG
jgi:hypothetical protein